MDKILKDDYEQLSYEDQFAYLTEMLDIVDGKIYGKVIGEARNSAVVFVRPYNLHGKSKEIFLDSKEGWGILTRQRNHQDLSKGDYVCGQIVRGERGPYIANAERMESFESFREKLADLLKKRWQREGFQFGADEIARFEGETAFAQWAADKVEAMLEDKYETFIQDKMKGQEEMLHDLENEVERLKEGQLKGQEALDKLRDKEKEARERLQHYKDIGIILEDEEPKTYRQEYDYGTYGRLVDEVWAYLWKKKNLYYEEATVRHFMNALRTQQLTILWGKPGTGKTSLPRGVADALGAECIRVQVQSNWTDNQDLLGFYNIVEKRYVPTQFMDALVEAKKHEHQLYIILLDEMNLSNVEYYFSEMLNVFTWDKPYTFHLYSEKQVENAQKTLQILEEQGKDLTGIKDILEDMQLYPPRFTIPANVRFVGTLNTDATTKTISPKVIDRSCIIELQAISREKRENEQKKLPEDTALDGESLTVGADKFKVEKGDGSEDGKLWQMVDQIREIMEETHLYVSNRIDSYIGQWLGWEDNCVDADEIVLEKILPIIDLEDNETNKKMIGRLKEILKEYGCERSLSKLETMERRIKARNRIMYWEN